MFVALLQSMKKSATTLALVGNPWARALLFMTLAQLFILFAPASRGLRLVSIGLAFTGYVLTSIWCGDVVFGPYGGGRFRVSRKESQATFWVVCGLYGAMSLGLLIAGLLELLQ